MTQTKAQTGGSINDEELFMQLFSGARIQAGGIPLSEDLGMFQTSRACRFPIAGRGVEMVICGKPVPERAKAWYCEACYQRAYYAAAPLRSKSLLKASDEGILKAKNNSSEPILDLLGEEVKEIA